MCDEYLDAIIGILEEKEWDWSNLVEFTYDEGLHSNETATAAVYAWGTCFPHWTGEDVNGDEVVDVNDVKMLVDGEYEHEILFDQLHDEDKEGKDIFGDTLNAWYFADPSSPQDVRITDDFIVFVLDKVSESMCDQYLDAVVGVLEESSDWNWDQLVEFTFDEGFHSNETA